MRRVLSLLAFSCSGIFMLTACGTASGSPSQMKAYVYNSSLPIGKTNAQDNAEIKKSIYLAPNIPGLNVQTPVLNMKNDWGMKPNQPSDFGMSTGWYIWDGLRTMNGITESYGVAWRSPFKVDNLRFVIHTSNGNTSFSQLKAEAIRYLGYAATLPYTGANPSTAKAWVTKELQTYSVSDSIKNGVTGIKIGKVYFLLTPYQKMPGNQIMAELNIGGGTMSMPESIYK